MSPKKIRLVTNLLTGMKVHEALNQLSVLTKAARRPVEKLLLSAVANAEHNFGFSRDNLYISSFTADLAGMLKRFTPKAHGRATVVRKRMSHVIVTLAEIVPSAPKKRAAAKAAVTTVEEKPAERAMEHVDQVKKQPLPAGHEKESGHEIVDPRMEGKHRRSGKDSASKKATGGVKQKFFNRKSG